MLMRIKLTVLALLLSSVSSLSFSRDWPTWRGPNRNGISPETKLLAEWDEEGPPLAWRVESLGKGYSSVAVAGDLIYTLGAKRGGCLLMAVSRKDGSEVWSTQVEGGGNPNCTPTVHEGLVYALGRQGALLCANAETGDVVWRKNFKNDFGGFMMSGWGYSESPLVDDDKLICTPGGNSAVIVALDRKTGDLIWKSKLPDEIGGRGRDGAGYSSIVISRGAGVKQYIQLTGRGVISVAAADGRMLWHYNRIANGTANIPTPLVKDNYVFCSTGYGTGAALLKLSRNGDDVNAEEVYFLGARDMQNHHGGMILHGDYVYCGHGHNKGFPLCIELKTGKQRWQERGPGSGSAAIIMADGHLYFRYQDGTMALIEANPEEYRLKGSFQLASKNAQSWPHPVIVDGMLLLRDQHTLLCYDIRRKAE